MRFDSASSVEEVVWDMRIAEEPRAADRTTLLRLYNGNPPYDEATAEENNVQVNRNDLEGVNILAQARRQRDNAFLKPSYYFVAKPDFGPAHKRMEWQYVATRAANRLLKRSRPMIANIRAESANLAIFGLAPSMWKDRSTVVPKAVPVGSLLVPSETEIDDFDNLSYFAIFREWTAAQLYDMTNGPRVDPGWNMPLVRTQMDWIRDELRKSPNSLAYQYMPERIEELIKQDKGYFGSDAVPTIDVWDFYFREPEKGNGWYRRVILDWGGGIDVGSYGRSNTMPASKNKVSTDEKQAFLYTSGHRKYASHLDELLHCPFADFSAYAPVKYHSTRGLGWMLWGICDLQNRMHCKFNEAVFEQFMWFFQTAGNQDLMRLKKANFEHMGVIPQGIRFLTPNERYKPDAALAQMAFARNRQLMADSSSTYTQDYDRGAGESARTATETMAIVNSSQSLASGIIEISYTYSAFKYRELFRRLCKKNSKDTMAQAFRLECLKLGIPEDMLDSDKWTIEPEKVVGGGNKTIQMATIGFLNQIRANLPPTGQRLVDHMSVEAATDQPELAQEIAPLGENQPISNSAHDAEEAWPRLMMGLPFNAPKDAVIEDYVGAWMQDLAVTVKGILDAGGMATPDQLKGMMNAGSHIAKYLDIMASNPSEAEMVKEYQNHFKALTNHVKALAQRLQQAMKAQAQQGPGTGNGEAEENAKLAAKLKAQVIQAEAKAANTRESHAQRTQQRQVSWENEERRKDQQTAADLHREGLQTRHELLSNRLRALAE